jgi:hypothetical protein
VNAHDIKSGVVFEDKNVKVTAFPTPHGELPRGREISDEQYLAEVHQIYRGAVVVARDLDVY